MRFWYIVLYVIVRIAFFFWHPVARFKGRENIPEGGAVFCANHAGMSDPLWILLALRQPNLIRVIAKKELETVPVVGWILKSFHIIFVNRGSSDMSAYDACVDALKANDKLLIFIEGTRVKRGKHVRAKTGAVRMAAVAGVPAVPVYITREKKLFGPIDVVFGEPVVYDAQILENRAQIHRAADELLKTIYRTGGDDYADYDC